MEREKKLVVDASVAVKWFAVERFFEKALELRDAYINGTLELIAPSLMLYEVANALRFHRKLKFSREDITNATISIKSIHIVHEPSELDWIKAAELSLKFNITIYDAIYISVALNNNCKLVTSDERLYSKLKKLQDSIILLKYF